MKKFLIIFTVLWLFVVLIIAFHGGFKTVKVETVKAGPFNLLYLEHKGPYRDVGKAINEVNTLLRDNSISTIALFGMYFDKPSDVPEDKLRSLAGALVDDKSLAAASGLIKEGRIKQKILKEAEFAKTDFPFKNMLSMLFAIRKVYPALEQYSKDNNLPEYKYKETGYEDGYILEIYQKNKTEFFMPTGN